MIVPPRSPEALAAAMRTLLRDGPARHAMGQRGRARVARDFTIDATVTRTAELYERLLAESR